jgi:hypothetical protein
MMEGGGGQRSVKSPVTEGQGFRHSLHCGTCAGISLGNHGGGRLYRHDTAVRGFVIARAGPHVQNAIGISQRVDDQLVNARVRTAGGRIPNADVLVDLIWSNQSLLL